MVSVQVLSLEDVILNKDKELYVCVLKSSTLNLLKPAKFVFDEKQRL